MLQSADRAETTVVWKPLPGSQAAALSCPADHILYDGSRGPGKGLLVSEPVLTDTGWKKAGEVTMEDMLVAPDGTYTRLAGIFPQGVRDLYRITFDEKISLLVDGNHRWLAYSSHNGCRLGWQVFDTETLRQRIQSCNFSIPTLDQPAPGKQWVGFDPYIVGQLLGDRSYSSIRVTFYTGDEWTKDYFEKAGWSSYDYEYRRVYQMYPVGRNHEWLEFLGGAKGDKKCVPPELLVADPAARLALLQGLMDSDGTCEKTGTCKFTSISEQLIQGLQYLVRSLGGKCTYKWRSRGANVGGYGGPDSGRFIAHVNHCNKFIPFRLPRKVARLNMGKNVTARRVLSIEPEGRGETVCFAVEHPSKLFVVKDFIVSHNTDAQLMKFRQYVGRGYGQFWRGVIFDREYKNLDDLVSKSVRWFYKFGDGAKFHSSKADYHWSWPTGEQLLFRQVKKLSDYWSYHGQEFPFIGWNELSKYPSSELYDMMMSCNRSSFRPQDYPLEDGTLLPKIPLIVFSTTNPYGAGHNWVKKRFVDVAPAGKIVKRSMEVFDPQTQKEEEVTISQARIYGSYRENVYLDKKYVALISSIKDTNKRKAWLGGDWDIVAGGAFDDVWNRDRIVLPRFRVPKNWKVDRTMDWGSSHPFSIGWWAEANGEEVQIPVVGGGAVGPTRRFCPPRGSFIRIFEWYGTEEIGTNRGLKMSAVDVARGVVSREKDLLEGGWIPCLPDPGPADNQIFEVRERDTDSIAKKMADERVIWTTSDKGAGSRKNGMQLVRDRFEAASDYDKGPGLFVMENCTAFISTVPVLPRDEDNPDDVDTDAEDHPYDETRYKVLAGNSRAAAVIPISFVR